MYMKVQAIGVLVLSMCHRVNRAFPRILINRRSTFDFPFSYKYNT